MKVVPILFSCFWLVACNSQLVLVKAQSNRVVEAQIRNHTTGDEEKMEAFVHFGDGPGDGKL